MQFRLLSLIEPAPDGFTYCPSLQQKDVRRWPFALLADNLESALAALQPFGSAPVGIIVTHGDRFCCEQRTSFLLHLTIPPACQEYLTKMVQSHLELLGGWHQTELSLAGQQLNLSRAVEDSNRHQLEFAEIKENLLNELSERKRVENELRSTRNHLAATLEAMPDLLFEVDLDGRIFDYYSPRTELLAAPPEQFLYKKMIDILEPDVARICQAAIQEAQSKGTSSGKQYELSLPAGRFWFELSVSTKGGGQGDDPRFIMLARDITRRKRIELELHKKNTDMEQFLYTVSHDLRSPLVTVKTFLGYLECDMAQGDRDRINQDLQFIHSATDKMKLLLDELLELSRVDRVATPPVKVSFREVIQEVLDVMAGVVNDYQVELRLPQSDLMLYGDRPRFCQVWQNLIENAVKYRNDNIELRLEIGVSTGTGEHTYYVKDNGIGIDPRYHDRIFNMFEKLDRESSGAGMGLAMVRRIIEKFNGRIWVESGGIGQGTCFYFTLPGAAPAEITYNYQEQRHSDEL